MATETLAPTAAAASTTAEKTVTLEPEAPTSKNGVTEPPATPAEPSGSSSNDDLEKKLSKIADAVSQIEKTTKENETTKPKSMERFARTIPAVRECFTWDDFKNHHSSDEHCHAIETLIAGESLKTEIEEAPFHRGAQDDPFRSSRTHRGGWSQRNARPAAVIDDGDEIWLQRVRINSKAVMMYLGRQSSAGKRWKGRPHVFQRPFRYLIHFHDKMKEILAELEENELKAKSSFKDSETKSTLGQDAKDESKTGEGDGDGEPLGIDTLFSDPEALADMRVYVKLIDDKLMPDYNRFSGDGDELPDKIRWDDLWYLFRPNQLLYAPPGSGNGSSSRMPMGWAGWFQRMIQEEIAAESGLPSGRGTGRGSHTDQMIWKVYQPPHKAGGIAGCTCDQCMKSNSQWTVSCYHIDYDGRDYRAVGRNIEIPMFSGERDITQLPCYPIRYVKKSEEMMETGRSQGLKFIELLDPTRRYAFYRGWTVIKTPSGGGIEDKQGRLLTSPEHIESEILVDFEEAFNTEPSWKPETLSVEENSYQVIVTVDGDNPLQEWTDKSRTELKETWEDRDVVEDNVDVLQMNQLCKDDPYLSRKRNVEDGEPKGDDLALLPRRLFAYALWERKFVQVDAKDVKAPDFKDKDKAFDNLEISPEHKTLIESLVYSHFQKRINEGTVEIASQDIIRGKGKGIVILLFGVPGVGKTATAEAVAQKFEKPLFPITCGDLGFTPESVESSLTEIFRLAHLWDCVLLLDEADVFITQRDRSDLERNALVSVFLRMLEYYNGILFLTTNRPGVLDEAVKSRVHLNLRYNFLSEEQVTAIFKLNIGRLREIEEQASRAPNHKKLFINEKDILEFARDHWRNNTDGIGRWNGRQIRNAFLIAASLAHYEGDVGERDEGLQKQLTSKHFKKVEETTRRYDEYRVACLGHTDSYIAHDRYERDDDWTPRNVRASYSHPGAGEPPGPGYLVRQGSKPWQRPAPAPMPGAGGYGNPMIPAGRGMNPGGWTGNPINNMPPPATGHQHHGPMQPQPNQGGFQPQQGAPYNQPSTMASGPNVNLGGINTQAGSGPESGVGMGEDWNGGGQPAQQRWQQNGFSQY